jgi:hydrogenase/urease accessory protein HupE
MRGRLLLAALLMPLAAAAHQQSISTSEIVARGERLEVRLHFATADLLSLLPLGNQGALTQAEIDRALPALVRLTLEGLAITSREGPCARENEARAEPEGPDGLLVEGAFRCPATPDLLRVRMRFLETLAAGHTHLASVQLSPGQISQRVASETEPSFEVETRVGFLAAAGRFLLLGIEHIFTGYDHIAFLLGLLLLGGTFRELVKVVTAFTVAHSVTLALATLEVVRIGPRIVEPLIAASIVYVAVENLWALRSEAARASALRHRWLLTLGFGLVHGFGFADALQKMHLPRSGIVAALFTFNLGVEVGQVCIVAVAFPLLSRLRRARGFDPLGVRAASACVGALGLFWLVQRLSGG